MFADTFTPSLTGGGAGPSTAAGRGESMFNSSGWNVNFGAGTIKSDAEAGGLSAYLPYVLAAAAVVIAWRMSRNR